MSLKISVVVPAYNAEKTIIRTLHSIVNQTYKNVQIVIVNDGSKDNTKALCEQFIQEYKNVDIALINIPNGGLANARNTGLPYCTGELYHNLDSDDYIEFDTYEKAVSKFQEDDVDVCFFGYKEFDESNQFFGEYEKSFGYFHEKVSGIEAFESRIRKKIWICQGNAVYRMSLIRDNQIANIPKHDQGEDLYFISKALICARNVSCFEGNNFSCMMRSDSMNHSSYNDSFLSILALLNLLAEDVSKMNQFDVDQKHNILKLIKAEFLTQYLNIIKRVAKAKSLKEYLDYLGRLKYTLPSDFSQAELLEILPKIRKIEYNVFIRSKVLYYFFVRGYATLKEAK